MNANSLLLETINRIQGAYAPSTIRAYRTDFAEFIGFCEAQGLDVFPSNPVTPADFIAHVSDKDRSSASIRRAIAGISTIYRLNRMPDPSKDPEVIIAMKRMHRKLGRAANQAQGITSNLLDQLLAAFDYSPRGIRNRALLLIAYDTLCRQSELVSLQIQDVQTLEKDGSEHDHPFTTQQNRSGSLWSLVTSERTLSYRLKGLARRPSRQPRPYLQKHQQAY